MNLKNRVVRLGVVPGGAFGMGLVYEDGQPIPPQTSLPITAGQLNTLLIGWMAEAMRIARAAGVEDGARAGAIAGAKAGVKYAYANSVVRTRIEYDESGQLTGTLEQRVPMAALESPEPNKES